MPHQLILSRNAGRQTRTFGIASFLVALPFLISCTTSPLGIGSRPAWNDIDVIRENVELPRAHFVGLCGQC